MITEWIYLNVKMRRFILLYLIFRFNESIKKYLINDPIVIPAKSMGVKNNSKRLFKNMINE